MLAARVQGESAEAAGAKREETEELQVPAKAEFGDKLPWRGGLPSIHTPVATDQRSLPTCTEHVQSVLRAPLRTRASHRRSSSMTSTAGASLQATYARQLARLRVPQK